MSPGFGFDDEATERDMDETELISIGVDEMLAEACLRLNWTSTILNQREVLPRIISGRDVVYVGKRRRGLIPLFITGIIQRFSWSSSGSIALILTPDKDDEEIIAGQFKLLAVEYGFGVVTHFSDLLDDDDQSFCQSKRNVVIVATKEEVIKDIERLKSVNFKLLKYLVIYDAHLFSSIKFDFAFHELVDIFPETYHCLLICTKVTEYVEKMKIRILTEPVLIDGSIGKLREFYSVAEWTSKEAHVIYIIQNFKNHTFIVSVQSADEAKCMVDVLKILNHDAILLSNSLEKTMSENLNASNTTRHQIYVATDYDKITDYDVGNVDVIAHLDIPSTLENFNKRLRSTKNIKMSIIVVFESDLTSSSWLRDYYDNKSQCFSSIHFFKVGLVAMEDRVLRALALINPIKRDNSSTVKSIKGGIFGIRESMNTKRYIQYPVWEQYHSKSSPISLMEDIDFLTDMYDMSTDAYSESDVGDVECDWPEDTETVIDEEEYKWVMDVKRERKRSGEDDNAEDGENFKRQRYE